MPELEPMRGIRAVGSPAALDGARWHGPVTALLRFAPDEAFAIGATAVTLDDPDAIVESEVGFVGGWVDLQQVEAHTEWAVPAVSGATLAQGSIAGVQAKLWMPDGGRALLVVPAAFAADLLDRLG